MQIHPLKFGIRGRRWLLSAAQWVCAVLSVMVVLEGCFLHVLGLGRAIWVCPALVLLIGSVRGGGAGLEGINLAGSVGVALGTAPKIIALTRCRPMEQAGSTRLFAASLKGGFLKFSAEMEDFLAKKQANHKALCDGLIVKGCLFFFFALNP